MKFKGRFGSGQGGLSKLNQEALMNSDVSGGDSGRVCKQESYTGTRAFSEVAVVAAREDKMIQRKEDKHGGRPPRRQLP